MRKISDQTHCEFYEDIRKYTDYKRVSCDFYDELTNASIYNQEVILECWEEKIQGKIIDVYTKDKEEFCVVGERHIRLDMIKLFLVMNA